MELDIYLVAFQLMDLRASKFFVTFDWSLSSVGTQVVSTLLKQLSKSLPIAVSCSLWRRHPSLWLLGGSDGGKRVAGVLPDVVNECLVIGTRTVSWFW